eukprot:TRINITY_DN6928_c0_g2_i2.p2 TRINITY_DN6928_c0_g2~~TRINITY_DN6928_c0_g2_i2.p2  ORF type:complete len:152 (-),score=27.94 TRINITY_DN6928_c0_g2_i2:441-896(-)
MKNKGRKDLNNYKGEHYDSDNEKHQDPVTGAHFRYKEVCDKLRAIQKEMGHSNVESLNQPPKSNCFSKIKSWNIYRHLFKSQDSIASTINPLKRLSSINSLKPVSNIPSTTNRKAQKLTLLSEPKDKPRNSKKPITAQAKYEQIQLRPSFV